MNCCKRKAALLLLTSNPGIFIVSGWNARCLANNWTSMCKLTLIQDEISRFKVFKVPILILWLGKVCVEIWVNFWCCCWQRYSYNVKCETNPSNLLYIEHSNWLGIKTWNGPMKARKWELWILVVIPVFTYMLPVWMEHFQISNYIDKHLLTYCKKKYIIRL